MAAGGPAAADGNSSAAAHSAHSLLPKLMREARASSLPDGSRRSGASGSSSSPKAPATGASKAAGQASQPGSGSAEDAMATDASKAAAVWDARTAGQDSHDPQRLWPV